MRWRNLAPTEVLSADGRLFDTHQQNPLDEGSVDVRMLGLNRDLTFQDCRAVTAVDSVFELKVHGDPFKVCFNLSDRTVMNYVEGLPVRPYHPGEMLLYPLTKLAMLAPRDTQARFTCLFISSSFMREVASDFGLPRGPGPASDPSPYEPWLLSARIPGAALQSLAMIQACPLHGALRRLYVEAKTLEILALVLERMQARYVSADEPRLRPRDVRKVQDARDIIESRLDDLPSLRELAGLVGMSATALKRAYRAVFGVPIFHDARNARLSRAKALLALGELSVSEAADRVGYQSLSHFSLAFKRQFGMLPSEIWPRTIKGMSFDDT
ncbi:MAG TPA: AraC family transcriptional regulator [Spirochaetia bacterium]|nr:AraC family transcriptional regulator [Spirochaetia bacterium]